MPLTNLQHRPALAAASRSGLAQQRGATLLEGLISILLMAIVGMGITFILSRAALAQSSLNAQNSVIAQLRGGLQNVSVGNAYSGVTPSTTTCTVPLPAQISLSSSAAVSNATTCSVATVTVSVAGATGAAATGTSQLIQIGNTINDTKLGGAMTVNN